MGYEKLLLYWVMYVVMHSYWSVASFIQGIQVWILVCILAVLIEWRNNSRYRRDFPLKQVATASNCHLHQTSPHLVRWYKISWLLNNVSIDIFHRSLVWECRQCYMSCSRQGLQNAGRLTVNIHAFYLVGTCFGSYLGASNPYWLFVVKHILLLHFSLPSSVSHAKIN